MIICLTLIPAFISLVGGRYGPVDSTARVDAGVIDFMFYIGLVILTLAGYTHYRYRMDKKSRQEKKKNKGKKKSR